MSAAVVVVGSVNMDLVVRMDHLPAPGETVVGGSFVRVPGGKGANQAASGANAVLDGRAVADAVRSVPAEAAVVLACLEVGEDAVLAAARAARARGFAFVLNPAPVRSLPNEVVAACTA